jgi:hypothetical protein
MKKEDVIFNEITRMTSRVCGLEDAPGSTFGYPIKQLATLETREVDPIKLAKFLSKFIDMKLEDIIE